MLQTHATKSLAKSFLQVLMGFNRKLLRDGPQVTHCQHCQPCSRQLTLRACMWHVPTAACMHTAHMEKCAARSSNQALEALHTAALMCCPNLAANAWHAVAFCWWHSDAT
eukprot:359736-Chlamydomonas_euryale.AAC.2